MCNCETEFCGHAGSPCPNAVNVDQPVIMVYAGEVCDECAETIRVHDGGSSTYLTAPYGTYQVGN